MQRPSYTLTVFRFAVVFFLTGLVADLSGFAGMAGAPSLLALIVVAAFLSILGVLVVLIEGDRWWEDSPLRRSWQLAEPAGCAQKLFLVPKLKLIP